MSSPLFRSVKSGFSLVELLVVTTIIAVILSAVVVSFQRANQSARDAKRKSDITELKGILENYRLETGEYPDTVTGLSGTSYDETTDGTFLEVLSPIYKSRMYNDPLPSQGVNYYRYQKHNLPGCQYELGAFLEAGDPQPCPSSCGITSAENYYCVTD
jgi:prepilin-type N-terminal cleavage/methylation domain-containing protein